jgi:hypothetical protein
MASSVSWWSAFSFAQMRYNTADALCWLPENRMKKQEVKLQIKNSPDYAWVKMLEDLGVQAVRYASICTLAGQHFIPGSTADLARSACFTGDSLRKTFCNR